MMQLIKFRNLLLALRAGSWITFSISFRVIFFRALPSLQCRIDSSAISLPAVLLQIESFHMSLVIRKPTFCICKNKDADQLRGNREAEQRLCFRYIDNTIPLLSLSEIS